MKTTIKDQKSNYEVYSFKSGYFGISKIGSKGANPIFGGDSANEDDYNKEYIESVFNNWNEELSNIGNGKYVING